jgi:hypothetical protein
MKPEQTLSLNTIEKVLGESTNALSEFSEFRTCSGECLSKLRRPCRFQALSDVKDRSEGGEYLREEDAALA